MADASTTTAFKQNSRTSRIVYATQPPVSGIYDTDIPTSPAYARALINFESNNEGTGIAPRPGIEQIDLYPIKQYAYNTKSDPSMYTIDSSSIIFKNYIKDGVEYNNIETKRYVIISDDKDISVSYGIKIDDEYLCYTDYLKKEQGEDEIQANVSYNSSTGKDGVISAYPIVYNNKLISTTAFETNDLFFTGRDSDNKAVLLTHKTASDDLFDTSKVNTAVSPFIGARAWIVPKSLTPAQATAWGFNMLSKNPYTFESTVKEGDKTINALGLLPYTGDKVVLNTLKNTQYAYKLISEIGSEGIYAIKAQYKQVYTDQWNEITGTLKKELNADAVKNHSFVFASPVDSLVMRLSFYKKSELPLSTQYLEMPKTEWEGTKLDDNAIYSHKDEFGNIFYYKADSNDADSKIITYYPEASDEEEEALFKEGYRSILTFPVAFNYTRTVNGSQDLINYELCSAKGMCYWRNRLILWGVDNGAPVLFFSELNDPSYFPYPNNISVLPEPIIKAVPFQDSLLVFTKTQVWQITLNADGLTWTETCLQKNLKIDEKDSHLIIPLSNMVFFKSDLFYYMLVPSSKGTGTLVLATIYKPVEKILRNIENYLRETINLLYSDSNIVIEEFRNPIDLNSTTPYVTNAYLDYDTIRIVYSILLDLKQDSESYQTVYNYCLNYNTNTRVWTTYVFESNSIPQLVEPNSIKYGVWGDLFKSKSANIKKDNFKRLTHMFNMDDIASEITNGIEVEPGSSAFELNKELLKAYLNHYCTDNYETLLANNAFPIDDLIGLTADNIDLIRLYQQTFKINNKLKTTDLLYRSSTHINNNEELYDFPYNYAICYFNNSDELIAAPSESEIESLGITTFLKVFLNIYWEIQPISNSDTISARLVFEVDKVKTTNLGGFYKDVNCTIVEPELAGNTFIYFPGTYYSRQLSTDVTINGTNYSFTEDLHTLAFRVHSYLGVHNELKPPYYIQNYQYTDTGPLDLNSSLYKKFRNYYIDVVNLSDSDLDFYVEFNVDNNLKVPLYTGSIGVINGTYDITYDLNEDSKQTVYGSVKGLKDGLCYTINGTTWDTPYIARLKSIVTCKGLRPGLKIYSKNQTPYEILNTTWVYRYKNAR